MRYRIILVSLAVSLMGCSSPNSDKLLYPVSAIVPGGMSYINTAGEMVGPIVSDGEDFYEGRAWCYRGKTIYLIDDTGRILFTEDLQSSSRRGRPFSGGVSVMRFQGEYYLVNRWGDKVRRINADRGAFGFSEGLAAIHKDERWGYIDRQGDIKIECQFLFADFFSEGLAVVCDDKGYGYIDTKGAFVIAPLYTGCWGFSNGYGLARDSNYVWHVINRDGNHIRSLPFDHISGYSDGVVIGSVDSLYGWMSLDGRWIVKPQFPYAGEINKGEGMIFVELDDGHFTYFTLDGVRCMETSYEYADRFHNGVARVGLPSGEDALIDRSGNILFKCKGE